MNSEPNIVNLLRQLRDDTTALVREEIVLAKTEISEKVSYASHQAVYLGIGAFVGSSALLLLLMSLGYLLTEVFLRQGTNPGTAAFLGFLIVAVVVGIISAALISKAIKGFRKEPIIPDRTVQSLREDKQWAQSKLSS